MIKNRIEIKKNLDGYYILLNNIANDDDIIAYLGITNKLYFEKGLELGGENIEEGALYFHYKADVNKFVKWIEKNIDSFLVAKKLVGDSYGE